MSHHVPSQLTSAIFGAILAERRGCSQEAADRLRRAMTLGAPQRFIRLFLDVAPLLHEPLLELANQHDQVEGLPELLAAFGSPVVDHRVPSAAPSLEMLTIREAEVFELLADRLTYKEIAFHLSISPETVKRHVNSIYAKLDVSSRREALLKAHQLGWHPAA